MIWLIVLLGILGLIAVLLAIPVTVRLSFDSERGYSGKIQYLFLKFRLPPEEKEEKDTPKKKEKKEPDEKKKGLRDIIKQKGFSGFLDFIAELTSIAGGTAKRLISHIRLKELKIKALVAGEDAACTAVAYGAVSALVYPIASAFITIGKCKHYDVSVTPDFEGEESSAKLFFHASVRLLFVVIAGLYALLRYVKRIIRQKKEQNAKTEPVTENGK